MIHNEPIYYKSFTYIASSTDHTNTGTWNEMRISHVKPNSTWGWHELKAGYTSFTKFNVSDGRARSYSSTDAALDLSTGPKTNTSITQAELSSYLTQTGIVRPLVSTNRLTAHNYCLANGGHLMSFEEYQILFYWLPAIEFNTFEIESNTSGTETFDGSNIVVKTTQDGGYPMWYTNTYSVLNVQGWNSLPSGYTNALGNYTGWVNYIAPKQTDTPTSWDKLPAVRYRGFEIHRDIWTNCFGGYGLYSTSGATDVYLTRNRAKWDNSNHITDDVLDSDFRNAGTQAWNGYGSEFSLNTSGDIVPIKISSSSNLKRDYSYGAQVSGPTWLIFGGISHYSSDGGPGSLISNSGATNAGADVGFRLRVNEDEYDTIYN